MNIAWSFTAEGLGHAARAAAIIPFLSKKHNIHLYCADEKYEWIKPQVKIASRTAIPYVKMIRKHGRPLMLRTILHNTKYVYGCRKLVARLAQTLRDKKIDVVVCDWEPIMARAAKKAGVPVIYFNNQEVFDRMNILWPWDAFIVRGINIVFAPAKGKHLVTSFYHGDVGTVLTPNVRKAKVSKKDHILVYNKAVIDKHVMPSIKEYSDVTFVFTPLPADKMAKAIATSRGYIGPAGAALMGELIVMQKPALLFPEPNQLEQQLNAQMMERCGRAIIGDLKNPKRSIELFLSLIDSYPWKENLPDYFKLHDDTEVAAKRIEQYAMELTQ